jgi:hypothetical protein
MMPPAAAAAQAAAAQAAAAQKAATAQKAPSWVWLAVGLGVVVIATVIALIVIARAAG